jgi:hypothetical protein
MSTAVVTSPHSAMEGDDAMACRTRHAFLLSTPAIGNTRVRSVQCHPIARLLDMTSSDRADWPMPVGLVTLGFIPALAGIFCVLRVLSPPGTPRAAAPGNRAAARSD